MSDLGFYRYLDLFRCPVGGRRLVRLDAAGLAALNRDLAAGARRHRDGTPAQGPVEAAVATEDGNQAYAVADGIACLLPDLALVRADATAPASFAAEKRVVQNFYDEYGWVRTGSGLFNDTAEFTDVRERSDDYRRHCNRRIARLLPGGRALLDVASGAVPHAEYLDFSRNYEVRICVDFSIRALREARAKLGERGLYVLGDITRLPFATDAVDDVISLHTVYHVPLAEQTRAIDEVVRVTKPGGRAIVVYVWSESAAMDAAFRIRGWLGGLRRRLRGAAPFQPGMAPPRAAPVLYFQPQDYGWYAREVALRHRVRLRVWSAISASFQARFVPDNITGRMVLAMVKLAEAACPRLAGRIGQYPMFILKKPSRLPGVSAPDFAGRLANYAETVVTKRSRMEW